MEGAFAWIGRIAEWVGQFIPRRVIIDSRQGAVRQQTVRFRDLIRFRWDTSIKLSPMAPGFHVYWPATTVMKLWVTARAAVNLSSQIITTKDGITVVVGAVIIYRITDVMKIIPSVYNPDETVRDIAAGEIAQALGEATWEELLTAQAGGQLTRVLRRDIRRKLRPFGVAVPMVRLTDFAKASLQDGVMKLMHSTNSDSNANIPASSVETA